MQNMVYVIVISSANYPSVLVMPHKGEVDQVVAALLSGYTDWRGVSVKVKDLGGDELVNWQVFVTTTATTLTTVDWAYIYCAPFAEGFTFL